jgi:MFS family permease
MSAVTAAATQPAWRATFFAVRGTLESIASTVAPLAGGLVADRWGAPVAFLGAMPLFTLVLLIIWRLDYSTVAVARRGAEAAPGGVRRLRAGLARLAEGIVKGPHPRTAMVVLALQVLNGLSNGLLNVGIPLLMQDRFGSGYAGISGISAVTALGTALTLIVGGRVADRHGRRRVILFSFAAALALFVPILWASSSAQFYVLFFLICLVGNAGGGAYSALVMECVREDIRATYGGVIQGLFSLGFAAGSVLSGAIYARSALAPVHGVIAINVAYLLLGLLLEETGPRARGGAAPLR